MPSRKGSPNKINSQLAAMIERALHDAGGRDYLVKQAEKNPAAFMALLGKCLPKDIRMDAHVRHTLEDMILGRLPQVDERPSTPSH